MIIFKWIIRVSLIQWFSSFIQLMQLAIWCIYIMSVSYKDACKGMTYWIRDSLGSTSILLILNGLTPKLNHASFKTHKVQPVLKRLIIQFWKQSVCAFFVPNWVEKVAVWYILAQTGLQTFEKCNYSSSTLSPCGLNLIDLRY